MIVWINGSFGSGKTTLVRELSTRWPDALVVDPEDVGLLLGRIVPVATGDFQDLALWRRQVAELLIGLHEEYARPILVPMTLLKPDYRVEVFDALHTAGVPVRHFCLQVPAGILVQRVASRAPELADRARWTAARRWATERIGVCVAEVEQLPPEVEALDGELPVEDLATHVLQAVGADHASRVAVDSCPRVE